MDLREYDMPLPPKLMDAIHSYTQYLCGKNCSKHKKSEAQKKKEIKKRRKRNKNR